MDIQNHENQNVNGQPYLQICFSPHCQDPSMRIFSSQSIQAHPQCKKWIYPKLGQIQDQTIIDFAFKPLDSSILISKWNEANWIASLDEICNNITTKILQSISQMKTNIISKGRQLHAQCIKVADFICKSNLLSTEEDHLNFIKQINSHQYKNMFKNIETKGKLELFNSASFQSLMSRLKDTLKDLEEPFFQFQPAQYAQRKLLFEPLEAKFTQFISSKQSTSIKLSTLLSTFGMCTLSYVNQDQINKIQLNCWICNESFIGIGDNKKIKRNHCQQSLFTHVVLHHRPILIDKYAKKIHKVRGIKLNFKTLMRQIEQERQETHFIIIDRENIKTEIQKAQNVFIIEVMSQHSQDLFLSENRYIIAESKGKDAADILIILILFEIGKKKSKNKITVFTNDHFGQVLTQVFKSIGIQLELLGNRQKL